MEPATTLPTATAELEKRASIKAWHRFFHTFIAPRFRGRRMALFAATMPADASTRIIDLGGVETTWAVLSAKPRVTIVNMWRRPSANQQFTHVIGDACALKDADNAFDIAFSNSVVEHVGDDARQQAFADEVRRVAPRYFVRTPYRYFPVEPHFMCLGIQFLPKPMYKALVRWLSLWGLTTRPSPAEIDNAVEDIQLLTVRRMRELFPDARIVRERRFGFTKSLIAVKD